MPPGLGGPGGGLGGPGGGQIPPELMEQGLDAAREQYRLVTAERELLEKTLAGSVKVLIDMLAMASPIAFSRATRIRNWARKVGAGLGLPQRWQLEIAAMLGPVGLLSVPSEVLLKLQKSSRLPRSSAA